MNNREKFLIIILAAASILLGGFKLLIEPEMKNVSNAKATLEQAENSWSLIVKNKEKSNEINKANSDLQENIKTASQPFFPELDVDNIHIFFDGLARAANVQYDSFTMTKKTVAQIMIPQTINNQLSYPAKDAAQRIKNIDDGTKTETPEKDQAQKPAETSNAQAKDLVEMMTISYQFKGDYGKAVAIIDKITNCGRFVQISSLDMSMNEESLNVSITADCFGIVKLYEDDLSVDRMSQQPGKPNPFKD